MSHEHWLATGLAIVVIVILSLLTALGLSWGWSWLAISTLLFFISYPLIWGAWRCYHFWCQSLMQLATYTQILREGESNLRIKRQHPNNLLLALQQDIQLLACKNIESTTKVRQLDTLLPQILDSWPNPVCLFDKDLRLTYRNAALIEQLKLPLLMGTHATSLGFNIEDTTLTHPLFGEKWQVQCIQYQENDHCLWFFSATNVANALHHNKVDTQQSLIRVLGHEIRNSLTPMSSLADTLLCQETLAEEHVRTVLERIKRRSDRLLAFISDYSQLSKLPAPKYQWFDIEKLIVELSEMLQLPNTNITYAGPINAYGDRDQITHVLINVLKNAAEGSDKALCEVSIQLSFEDQLQTIRVTDNGPGFANLDNVLTPFYTTKANGSGIGLPLCAEIANNHSGELTVANCQPHGAAITLAWPIMTT
ncbi:sensor histidine kinase [Thalassotalea fusca]